MLTYTFWILILTIAFAIENQDKAALLLVAWIRSKLSQAMNRCQQPTRMTELQRMIRSESHTLPSLSTGKRVDQPAEKCDDLREKSCTGSASDIATMNGPGSWSRSAVKSDQFSSAVQKHKNQNIQNYNLACGSVWVWNLVSDIKGGT
jgi:hypothetical protein